MSTSPKQAMYAQFAALVKAIGHEHRLAFLELVAQGDAARRWRPTGDMTQ